MTSKTSSVALTNLGGVLHSALLLNMVNSCTKLFYACLRDMESTQF